MFLFLNELKGKPTRKYKLKDKLSTKSVFGKQKFLKLNVKYYTKVLNFIWIGLIRYFIKVGKYKKPNGEWVKENDLEFL